MKKSNQKIKIKLLTICICTFIIVIHSKAQTTWNLSGNNSNSFNFLGTTNNAPLIFRTYNVERFRIQPNGFVGIGVVNPLHRLDLFGNLRVRGNIYVDERVYQEGQFASDSIDAGLIHASSLSADKINVDSLRAYVIEMNNNSRFVGTANFNDSVNIYNYLAVGSSTASQLSNAEIFTVRNGNTHLFGKLTVDSLADFNKGINIGSAGLKIGNVNGSGVHFTTNSTLSEMIIGSSLLPVGVQYQRQCPSIPNFVTKFESAIEIFGIPGANEEYSSLLIRKDNNDFVLDAGAGSNYIESITKLKLNTDCGNDIITGRLGSQGNFFIANKLVVGSHSIPNNITNDDKLFVNGHIKAKEVIVTQQGWPDYVFSEQYNLKTLEETESYIKLHKHLPGVPSAKTVEKEGAGVAEMQKVMMEKIEELTLHIIELNKRIKELEQK